MMRNTWAAAVLGLSSFVIVRRADRPDARYLELGAQFPTVVALGRLGDATLIASQWLLTAAHVAQAVQNGRIGRTVTVGAHEYHIDRIVVHPAWRELGEHDIGLIHLSRPVHDMRPIALNRDSRERGQVATLVGHGGTGTGDSRMRRDDGRARGATSRVDSTSASWLYFSFDAPPGGTDLEGAPGPGDSGGPAFIASHSAYVIAGVSSAGFDGRDGPGSYGAIDVFTRVATHASWIDSVMRSSATGADATRSAPSRSGSNSVRLPDTPAGKRYDAFLRAMRAGTDSAIVGFLKENFDPAQLKGRSASQRLPVFRHLADQLHNARIEAIEHSEPLRLSVRLVVTQGSLTIELLCAADSPHKILDWRRYDS